MISILCLMISCLIISVENPQLFVMYLLFQSGLMVLFMGLKGSVWHAYILFLVFLGGMLILFVYASSLSSEVKLDYSLKKYFTVFFISLIMLLSVGFSVTNMSLSKLESYNIESSMMKELISSLSGGFYLYVMGYLLLTLYNVCWMMKIYEGPFKKFS